MTKYPRTQIPTRRDEAQRRRKEARSSKSENTFRTSGRVLIRHSLIRSFVILWVLGYFVISHSVAATLDTYGGFTDVRGDATGFFHTQKIDDRWWLVTPEGNGFFGIGLSHPVTGFSQGTVTFSYKGN